MFEVGITEIILIFGIALLVLGPERLPKLAADLGRWAGRARAMARTLRTQLEQETRFDPLQDEPSNSSSAQTVHAAPADENARAAPAQLATDTPSPVAAPQDVRGEHRATGAEHLSTEPAFDMPAPDLSYPDALLRPEKTADESKPA
jgi:sec-independent protein translocase protein TatB